MRKFSMTRLITILFVITLVVSAIAFLISPNNPALILIIFVLVFLYLTYSFFPIVDNTWDAFRSRKSNPSEPSIPYEQSVLPHKESKDVVPPSSKQDVPSSSEQNVPPSSKQDVPPWQKIPKKGWLRKAVELWHQNHSYKEIAQKLGVNEKTVRNKLSRLRQMYGEDIVPTKR